MDKMRGVQIQRGQEYGRSSGGTLLGIRGPSISVHMGPSLDFWQSSLHHTSLSLLLSLLVQGPDSILKRVHLVRCMQIHDLSIQESRSEAIILYVSSTGSKHDFTTALTPRSESKLERILYSFQAHLNLFLSVVIPVERTSLYNVKSRPSEAHTTYLALFHRLINSK